MQQGLDIRHARIATMGDNVVDTFYLRERTGSKITGATRKQTIVTALLTSIQSHERDQSHLD
jgi:UTP:GlnB (protein PII) uridylyltransferase